MYGTLMPGHLRWPVLEPHALSYWPAASEGVLYDTGDGWPAAVFRPGDEVVRGWAVDLLPERAELVLAHLDEVEDIESELFRRVRIGLLAGEPSWSYESVVVQSAWTPIRAWAGVER